MKTSFHLLLSTFAFMTVLNTLASAEDLFYYVRGEKILVAVSSDKICVKFSPAMTDNEIQAIATDEAALDARTISTLAGEKNFRTIRLRGQTDIGRLLQSLQNRPEIAIANPVYLIGGLEAIPTDRFIVRTIQDFGYAGRDRRVEQPVWCRGGER